MAEGSDTYKGLAVPLWGESEIVQQTAGNDILTLTAVTGASGDFLVAQTAGGGEVFVVGAAGEVSAAGEIALDAGAQIQSAQYLRFSTPPTTPPTTGLETGDLFLVFNNTTTGAALAVCVDGSGNSLRYIPFGTATFGRATA